MPTTALSFEARCPKNHATVTHAVAWQEEGVVPAMPAAHLCPPAAAALTHCQQPASQTMPDIFTGFALFHTAQPQASRPNTRCRLSAHACQATACLPHHIELV